MATGQSPPRAGEGGTRVQRGGTAPFAPPPLATAYRPELEGANIRPIVTGDALQTPTKLAIGGHNLAHGGHVPRGGYAPVCSFMCMLSVSVLHWQRYLFSVFLDNFILKFCHQGPFGTGDAI